MAVAMRKRAQASDTNVLRRNVSPVTLFSGVSADVLHFVYCCQKMQWLSGRHVWLIVHQHVRQ